MDKMTPEEVKHWFNLYYTRLCTFAFRLVNCKETARDLAQDAFVVLMNGCLLAKDDAGSVKSFLYSTVKFAALNRIRHQQAVRRAHEERPLEEAEEADVLQVMLHAEIIGELHAALESLPAGCATVCRMSYLEGMKNAEIAASLDVSINTVKTQKQRALTLLRGRLSPQALSVLLWLLWR